MKTIGIAAVTAEGASDCYKSIVKKSGEVLGDNKHPEIILINPSFESILSAQNSRDWETVATIISDSINKLAKAGAAFAIIPANSVHFAYQLIATKSVIPVLNLIDITIEQCNTQHYRKVGVLGVGMTMSDGLYDEPLASHSIESVRLNDQDMKTMNRIIYNELVHGVIRRDSVNTLLDICKQLAEEGCEALVLACTELPMVITAMNSPLPCIDTTQLLAQKSVDLALDS